MNVISIGLLPDVSVVTERLGDIEGLRMKSTLQKFYKALHSVLFARDGVHYVD